MKYLVFIFTCIFLSSCTLIKLSPNHGEENVQKNCIKIPNEKEDTWICEEP